jgi:IS5 family transposase
VKILIDTKAYSIFVLEKTNNHILCQISSPSNPMRKIINPQVQIGEINISDVPIEVDSRDEIPQLLRGLQYIYSTPKLWKKVRHELWGILPLEVDANNGREGMTLWKILVLGTLRLCCNWDYDKLQEIANNHMTLRQILGHGILDFEQRYPRQTLCDNLRWFTPDVLERINRIVVNAGHELSGVTGKDTIHTRCDSFVVETDVHFPTDINLLWDAVRKVLQLTHRMSVALDIDGWRQTRHNSNRIKRLYRRVQKERDRNKESTSCLSATRQYIDEAQSYFSRAQDALSIAKSCYHYDSASLEEIKRYIAHGRRQIRQIIQRCFHGKTIPASDKVYSLFEGHTEWISKGKAGVPQELGMRVCIIESEYGFVMHHRVMEQEEDKEVAVPIIKETRSLYRNVTGCSFDKGFHSPENQRALKHLLSICVLPKKGRLNDEERRWEASEEFMHRRNQHAAIESAINALENHSLDRCCDHGIDGFERYVALAIVSRNIQIIGKILQQRELEYIQKIQNHRMRRKTA